MYDSIMYGTTPTVTAAITRLDKDLTSHQVPTLNSLIYRVSQKNLLLKF